jgi:hypothetical protein
LLGFSLGEDEGLALGSTLGIAVGISEGFPEGALVDACPVGISVDSLTVNAEGGLEGTAKVGEIVGDVDGIGEEPTVKVTDDESVNPDPRTMKASLSVMSSPSKISKYPFSMPSPPVSIISNVHSYSYLKVSV